MRGSALSINKLRDRCFELTGSWRAKAVCTRLQCHAGQDDADPAEKRSCCGAKPEDYSSKARGFGEAFFNEGTIRNISMAYNAPVCLSVCFY